MNIDFYTNVFLRALEIPLTDSNVKEYKTAWWQNIRKKSTAGLRLTEEGFEMIHTVELESYEILFPKEMKITAQTLIFLDQLINCPYYITTNSIYVTADRVAVALSLFSGDIRKYGLAEAMKKSKREVDISK
jgi:hypothetical protein|tara:strand:+ start:8845 stop:9240 length:396 start_codon:yes stop_codon:yes gene_type:complete